MNRDRRDRAPGQFSRGAAEPARSRRAHPRVATEVKPLVASLTSTSDAARRTFRQAEKTLSLNEGRSAEIADSITETMKKAGESLDQMRSTLSSYQKVAAQNANVGTT